MSTGVMSGVQVLGNMATSMFNDMLLERDEKRREKSSLRMMNAQNDLLRENNRNAASDYVTGLKLAGLNPALAHAGNFSPAQPSQGNVSSGGAEMPPVDIASLVTASSNAKVANAQARNLETQNRNLETQNDLIKAQVRNVLADTNNKNAGLRGVEADSDSKLIDLTRKRETDAQARRNMLYFAQSIIDEHEDYSDSEVEFAYSLLRNKDLLNTGTLDGLNAFVSYRRNYSSADKELAVNAFERSLADLKNSNGLASKIYDMDVFHRELLLRQVQKVAEEIGKIRADTDLSKEQKKKVIQDAYRASVDAEKIISSDVSGNFSRGEYKRAFLEVLVRFLDAFSSVGAKAVTKK